MTINLFKYNTCIYNHFTRKVITSNPSSVKSSDHRSITNSKLQQILSHPGIQKMWHPTINAPKVLNVSQKLVPIGIICIGSICRHFVGKAERLRLVD